MRTSLRSFCRNGRIGIVPLPAFVLIFACLGIFLTTETGHLPCELSVIIAVLAVFGFACAELGRLPILRWIGGSVIVTTLLPSFLVHHQLLPPALVQSISECWQVTNILYFFIAMIIAGSILSMSQQALIKGCTKLFIPLIAGSIAAAIVGTLSGMAMGLGARHTFFYIVIPIMAGGLSEGAIPLTLGYAAILQASQPELFAQVMPPIVLGNVTAIVCASVLHRFAQRFPIYGKTGQHLSASQGLSVQQPPVSIITVESMASAGIVALSLYMVGMLVNYFTGWPAPLVLLGLAVLVRLMLTLSPELEAGSYLMYHLFAKAAAYPILFGLGLILTPWQALLAALTPAYCLTIFMTVLTLALTGFAVGRLIGLNPIESAIINVCHSGMGSLGDMAILTSAHRMHLMPFAQLATRIGGALTVTLALLLLDALA